MVALMDCGEPVFLRGNQLIRGVTLGRPWERKRQTLIDGISGPDKIKVKILVYSLISMYIFSRLYPHLSFPGISYTRYPSLLGGQRQCGARFAR